ncbi:MAG: PH domain-containing protein [Verrucomicrobia bacterium]|nr:PH domain-containing protein [Verrucomicrobiota bacterium]
MTDETTLWKCSPSQWLNLGPFSAAIALSIGIAIGGSFFPPVWFGLGVPLAYAIWRYLVVRCHGFELSTQRLRITTGVINQQIDEIELYRVKDTLTIRSWWMRLTGLATISLQTSDRSLPHLLIPAIRNGEALREQLRQQVEAQRDTKRVREMDFDETGNADGEIDADVSGGPA